LADTGRYSLGVMKMRYLNRLSISSNILSGCVQKVILTTSISHVNLASELLRVKANQMGIGARSNSGT
jgi:hypothetical protein